MPEPTSSAGGLALAKVAGGVLGIGVAASAMGFLVLRPKTLREATVRITVTILGSTIFGPFLCALAYWKYPEVFLAAIKLALQFGVPLDTAGLIGLFMVAAPLLAMAGLPFWWILGAIVLWFDKRKQQGKDIAQMAADAKAGAGALL